ncbi:MAG: Coenzyme F420 hydrogenase/dehydrogenase, beta subunit C-terminal domain [Parabacteroides sp.]|nr:Coenzyme F420 hydrogenase/dehydrogenase, beta subunit C-terminal domain [Parabacteroides sp.]
MEKPLSSKDAVDPSSCIVQHKDDIIRYQSTSGGAFTAIAEFVISEGGVVFGANLEDDVVVRHIAVENVQDLEKFRNSKYVQSEIGDTFLQAKKYLTEGRKVCFSGTPCQINGLKKFLKKDYPNLLTVDFACKAIPSPLIFKKYIEFRSKKSGDIKRVVFRDKKRGFSFCTLACYKDWQQQKKGKSLYRRGSESDEWLRLFLRGYSTRLSCTSCNYQDCPRVSDISLGDIWDTTKITPKMNDNKGTTTVAIWTEKGKVCLDSIREKIRFYYYPFETSTWVKPRKNIKIPNYNRAQFYEDAKKLPVEKFFAKYAPNSLKVKIKQFSRVLIWKIHLHNIIRQCKHFIIHR